MLFKGSFLLQAQRVKITKIINYNSINYVEDDLNKYGLSKEITGRLNKVVKFNSLNVQALLEILTASTTSGQSLQKN